MGSRRGDSESFKKSIFLLLVIVLVKQSASTYGWKCSPYDSANNRYYLPYFGETSEVFKLLWQDSTVGATYIYPINSNELNCTGLVTALEFCYTTLDLFPSNLFNFKILSRELNNVFNVMKSIRIRANPSLRRCAFSRCCEIMEFDIQDQFNITSSTDLAIAFGPRQGLIKNHQGLFANSYPMYTGFYHVANVPLDTGSSADLNAPVEVSLRLAWLHITPFPSTSTPPSSQGTTKMPTLPISEVSAVPEPSPNNSEPVPMTSNSQPLTFPYTPDPAPSPRREESTTSLPINTLRGNNSSDMGGVIGGVISALVIIFVASAAIGSVITTYAYRRRKTLMMRKLKRGVELDYVIYDALHDKIEINVKKNQAVANPAYAIDGGAAATPNGQGHQAHEYEVLQSQRYDKLIHTTRNTSEYDDVYVEPARDVGGLYAQLETTTHAVNRVNIRLGDRLGSGQFGEVFRGVWECSKKNVEVAVKTLKEGSSDEDRVKFLQEAAIMCQFRHPNVVTMYGVVTDGDPILLVLEILKNGDLRSYLLSMKLDNNGALSPEISGSVLLSYCCQVASGMLYLSKKSFVHRDLAARNILVSDDGVCKIADFGMSRDLAHESYYVSHGGKIPVKWTAPEALYYKKYSTSSDVWSYGALMFEIWSVGHKPFEQQRNAEVIRLLNSGYRLPPPPGCPRAIYCIMMSCWHPEPKARPKFFEVSFQLSGSKSTLLHWSEEDKSEFPSATELGADLSSSTELYKDLQTKYFNFSESSF